MRRLLDTNAYRLMRDGHPGVGALVRAADELAFSIVVVGELLHAFRLGSRLRQNTEVLDELLRQPMVTTLPVTRTTAEFFGETMTTLRRNGTPIPTNDVWIAAHCFESGAELLTFDRDFERVPGLLVRILS